MEVKIKVEKFLMRQGVRVGKAAIEFQGEGPLAGFHLVGFTICDDPSKDEKNRKYVMFPMAKANQFATVKREDDDSRNFYFLRAETPELLTHLQKQILDVYNALCEQEFRNTPRVTEAKA